MSKQDKPIVKITATVTDPAYIEPYVVTRKEVLGDLKPALMLSVVKETFKPEMRGGIICSGNG